MARLLIALGFADDKARSEPVCIYAGRDRDAMEQAVNACTSPVVVRYVNPVGLRKVNERAAANVILATAPVAAAAPKTLTKSQQAAADKAAKKTAACPTPKPDLPPPPPVPQPTPEPPPPRVIESAAPAAAPSAPPAEEGDDEGKGHFDQ